MRGLNLRNDKATQSSGETFVEGRVYSVILDSSHPEYSGEDSIGIIFWGDVSLNRGKNPRLKKLNKAKPYFSFIKQYPLKHEIVKILIGPSNNQYKATRGGKSFISNYYFPPTNTHNNSNHNATPLNEDTPSPRENSQEASSGIQQNIVTRTTRNADGGLSLIKIEDELFQTEDGRFRSVITLQDNKTGETHTGEGISIEREIAKSKARSNASKQFAPIINETSEEIPSDLELNLGEDFEENGQIKKLQPFEGDVTVEGRFGQGIRFGSTSRDRAKNNWSDNEGKDDPITIISNGVPKTDADATIEDVNQTDSIIIMTSNQNINNLEVASNNMQSIGTEFEEPTGEEVIIVDTPNPPIEPSRIIDPVPIPFENEEPTLIEQVTTIDIPTEPEASPIIEGDPIFALLDEGIESGEIEPLIDEVFSIASTEPDEDSEDGSTPENQSPSASTNANFNNQRWPSLKTNWRNGQSVTVYNKVGQPTVIPQPTENFNITTTSRRNIKYLWIHTTGMQTSANPIDVMQYHLRGNRWKTAGYHWLLPRTGRGACRIYPDSRVSSGVGGKMTKTQVKFGANKNAINISWIGGANGLNITQQQAYTLKRLVKEYVKKYPEIQVGGHNQMGRTSENFSPGATECPIFYVPKYCELIGLEEKNIFRGGWFGQQPNQFPNDNKYILNAETVFDLGGR